MFNKPSQYFVTFLKKVVTCWANSLVGTNIRDRILLSASCYNGNAVYDQHVRDKRLNIGELHTSLATKTLCTAGNP